MAERVNLFGSYWNGANPAIKVAVLENPYTALLEESKGSTFVLANPMLIVENPSQFNKPLFISYKDTSGKIQSKTIKPSHWKDPKNKQTDFLILKGLTISIDGNSSIEFDLEDESIDIVWELRAKYKKEKNTKDLPLIVLDDTTYQDKAKEHLSFTISKKPPAIISPVAIISLEFSGFEAGNTQTATLSEKISFTLDNPLGLIDTYTVQYSDTHIVPDWTQINPQSLSDIQTAINQGSDDYLLNFEVQSYTSFPRGVLTLSYSTENVTPTVEVVQLDALSQSFWFGRPQGSDFQLASAISANTPPSVPIYGLKTSINDDFTIYDLTREQLNTEISNLGANTSAIITVSVPYVSPNISDVLTLTFS